jgi:hypothetical protein
VAMIFADYVEHGMGIGAICEKLNRDLDRYPPPRRNRKDENSLRQTWSRSQLQAMLSDRATPRPKSAAGTAAAGGRTRSARA